MTDTGSEAGERTWRVEESEYRPRGFRVVSDDRAAPCLFFAGELRADADAACDYLNNQEKALAEMRAEAELADALYESLLTMRQRIPVDWPTGTAGDFFLGMQALKNQAEEGS